MCESSFDTFEQGFAVTLEVISCVWIDGSGVVLGVCLQEKQSRDEFLGLGYEGARSEPESRSFALPEYLTSYHNLPSKGAEIVAVLPLEASVNLIDSPEDRNSLKFFLRLKCIQDAPGEVVAILPWYLGIRKRS